MVRSVSSRPIIIVTYYLQQAQTPQQRRANAKFDKINEKKMGKPTPAYKKKDKPKSPVSPVWLCKST
jgi:hypothetical protein